MYVGPNSTRYVALAHLNGRAPWAITDTLRSTGEQRLGWMAMYVYTSNPSLPKTRLALTGYAAASGATWTTAPWWSCGLRAARTASLTP